MAAPLPVVATVYQRELFIAHAVTGRCAHVFVWVWKTISAQGASKQIWSLEVALSSMRKYINVEMVLVTVT